MKKILLATPLLIMALAEVSFAGPVQVGANNLPLGTAAQAEVAITHSPAGASKPVAKGVIVPNAVESVIFPSLADIHFAASGTAYWNLGDFIEGTRTLINPNAASVDMSLQVVNNGLTCDTQDHALLIDGAVVGNFSIAAGQTSVVQTFPFASLTAGAHTIRLETVRTVAPGCGAAGFLDDVSTLVFHSATGTGPTGAYNLTAGATSSIYTVQGTAITQTWLGAVAGSLEYPLAVSGDIRTTGASAGSFGAQYSLAGVDLGARYSLPITAYDGATDGTSNYAVDWAAGGVWKFDRNWANGMLLFTTPASMLGITYDPTDNTLWISHWGTPTIEHRDMTGNILGTITTNVTSITSLAIDYTDDSLWFGSQATQGTFYQYSKAGALMQTTVYTRLVPENTLGGEFDLVVTPPAPTPDYSIQFNTYSDCLNLWLAADGMATGNIPVVGAGTVFSGLYDGQNTLGGGFISGGGNYMYKFTVNSNTVDVFAVDPIGSTKTLIATDTWHVAPSCTGVMNTAPKSISAK